MISKKRQVSVLIVTFTLLLFSLVAQSYGASASIEYTYDEMGNILEKKVTYSDFPPAINCTVNTYPPGLRITVDGVEYTAPHAFSWVPGSPHTISGLPSPQPGGSGIQYPYWYWYPDYGAQTHTVAPSSDTTYTAYFSTQYNLTTSANPSGGGSISLNPSGGWYNNGQTVWVTATANPGYSFSNWLGHLGGSTNPASITMDGPKIVTANFNPNQTQYTLTTSVSPSNSGSVRKYPDKPTYAPGEQVTLTAGANTSYSFSNWTGSINGTTNLVTITMDTNKTVTATFTNCDNLPFRVGIQDYGNLQAAYEGAGDGSTIKCRGVESIGDLNVYKTNQTYGVTLQGGYDCGYSTYSGNMTFLQGTITTNPGTGQITVGNFILEQ